MDASDIDQFLRLYDQLKAHVRRADRHLYERWKAGGFLVDTDIVSMYPNLSEVLQQISPEEDNELDFA